MDSYINQMAKKSTKIVVNSQKERRMKTLNAEKQEFTCEICTETTFKNKNFNNNNLCEHLYCVDCIVKYAQVKIEDEKTAKIKCPELNCKQFLDPLSCRRIIEPSVFSKWCDLLFENYLLDFRKSFCPNRNCMELVVNECSRKIVKKAQCPRCMKWFCFDCKLPWHAGYSCEESGNLRDPADIVFGNLVEKMNWARCPGCGHCVERKHGCHRITCRCKTTFCYSCGRRFPCMCHQQLRHDIGIVLVVLFVFISFIGIIYLIRS